MRRKRTLTGFVGAGVWRKREANAGKINSMKTKIKLAIASIASALLTGCQSWMGLMLIIGSLAFTGCTHTVIKSAGWSATNTSILWTRKNLSASVAPDGTATVSETDSSPDAESIKVLAGTVAALAVKP